MTKERWTRIEPILDALLDGDESDTPEERSERLDKLCAGSPDLRAEVEALLDAEAHAPDFLEEAAADFAAPLFRPETDVDPEATAYPADTLSTDAGAASLIGPYRLVRELGRGGMGRVFLAERADGLFEQRTALKVLRGDVASDTMRHRLRSERQILAQLSHPGIARVFDGGVTDDDRPYLVLEYVDGVPIDAYCDQNNLSVRARLRLFEQVCAALQHAHRNLVVHRDLKPSNILVTAPAPDAEPSVKLLDFGIAKLLQDAEHEAPHTQTGERWMTPHYAAPEQVEGGAITTSTDVYALGVLLYQLLSGRRPFDDVAPHRIARAVVETEPAPPSTPPTAAAFGSDLDTIVLKALRKEPERRYASAEALADDVRRYLDGLPVAARRPTLRYHARKFVGRHRWSVAAAAAVLLLAFGGGLWHNVRLSAERDRAQAAALNAEREAQTSEQVTEMLTGIFRAGNPTLTAGDTLTAFDLLDRGAARLDTLDAQPAVQAELARIIGEAYATLGDFERGRPFLERAVRLRRLDAERDPTALASALETLADESDEVRDFEAATAAYREALALRRSQPGDRAALRTARTMRNLAGVLGHTQPDSGVVVAREALALLEAHGAPADEVRTAQVQLASVLERQGRPDEALALFAQALPSFRTAVAEDSSGLGMLASVLHNFASAHLKNGSPEQAIPLASEAVTIKQQILGDAHQSLTLSMRALAIALSEAERFEEARAVWEDRLRIVEANLPTNHWRIGNAHAVLGSFDLWRGQPDRAEPHLRDAHTVFARHWEDGSPKWPDWPNGHPWVAQSLFRLGVSLAMQGRYEEGEALMERGADGFDIPSYYAWNHYDDHVFRALFAHYEARGTAERLSGYRTLLPSQEGKEG